MALMRQETTCRDETAIARRSDQDHLWDDCRGHIAKPHFHSSFEAYFFQPRAQGTVRLQFRTCLITGTPEVRGHHHDDGHAIVNAGRSEERRVGKECRSRWS